MSNHVAPRTKVKDSFKVVASLFISILFSPEPIRLHFLKKKYRMLSQPDDELEEELKYLKAETYVITPSRIPQRIEKAPGAIYVVTDRQIRQMGARNLQMWSRPCRGGFA